MRIGAPAARSVALVLTSVFALLCLSSAPASATEATRPVVQASQFKGPSGNRVEQYCQRHLSDDTPRSAGLPNRALDCQLQWTAARFGYSGPIDGRLGPASWRGAQRYLESVGTFDGHLTGRLDTETKRAIQRKSAQAPGRDRYTGRITGSLSLAAWRGFAYFLDLPWAS